MRYIKTDIEFDQTALRMNAVLGKNCKYISVQNEIYAHRQNWITHLDSKTDETV